MDVYFIMAILRVYKRNSTFIDVANLVEEISRLGLVDAIQKYHNKPLEREAKSIVAVECAAEGNNYGIIGADTLCRIKYGMAPELHPKTRDILNVVVESITHSV
jgi:hypothetical protein